jgi:hypothetical protein
MADRKIRLLVQAEVKKAINDLDRLERQTDDNVDSANELSSTFKTLFGAAVLGAGARSVIQTASNFESLRTRLVALKGSTEEGAKAFNQFTQIAATTPFQVQNVVEAGATLEAFGVSSEESLKSIADLAAFMGTDIVDAAASFGRAFAGGAGAADVLRERGILTLIKDAEGIEDLSKLTLPEFRAALERAMTDPDGKIAGATDLLAQTFSGRISNMQDAIDRLQNAIGERFLKQLGQVAIRIGEVANNAATFVSELSDETIQRIQRLGLIVGGLTTAFGLYRTSVILANISTKALKKTLGVGLLIAAIELTITAFNALKEKTLEIERANLTLQLSYYKLREAIALREGKRVEFAEQVNEIEQKLLENAKLIEESKNAALGIDKQSNEEKTKTVALSEEELELQRQKELQEKLNNDLKAKEVSFDKEIVKERKSALSTLEQSIKSGRLNMASGKEILKNLLIEIASLKIKLAIEKQITKQKRAQSVAGSVGGGFFGLFATGGSFVSGLPMGNNRAQAGSRIVNRRTILPTNPPALVGDNASGMERVDVTPLPAPPSSRDKNITINISAPLVDETVVESIIPAIRRAEKLGL